MFPVAILERWTVVAEKQFDQKLVSDHQQSSSAFVHFLATFKWNMVCIIYTVYYIKKWPLDARFMQLEYLCFGKEEVNGRLLLFKRNRDILRSPWPRYEYSNFCALNGSNWIKTWSLLMRRKRYLYIYLQMKKRHRRCWYHRGYQNALVCYSLPWFAIVCLGLGLL